MENNQQKWVNLSFVLTSLLTAYVIFVLANKFSVFLDFEGRVRHLDKILMGASALVGIGIFLVFSRNNLTSSFMHEVVTELGKVTWPTQDETLKGTIAVLIAVVIAGVALWIIDSIWVYLIGLVI